MTQDIFKTWEIIEEMYTKMMQIMSTKFNGFIALTVGIPQFRAA